MRVYIWHPVKLGAFFGHVAIQIEDEYFSFCPNHEKNSEYELWTTASQDKNNLGNANEIIDINVNRIFHPYILAMFNPSESSRGLGGWHYNAFNNNCCHAASRFVSMGILPYLIDIFGNSEKDSYWLKWEPVNHEARREKINSLYFKHSHRSLFDFAKFPDPFPILYLWQSCQLYNQALWYLHGNIAAQSLALSDHSIPDQHLLFNPFNFAYLARYAKAVVEDLSGRVPPIPWIFEYEQSDCGISRKREIKSFERQMKGIKDARLKFSRFTGPFEKP